MDGVYLEDVQDYYDVLLIGGHPSKEAVRLARARFKLRSVAVNPVGRVTGTVPELEHRPAPPPPVMPAAAASALPPPPQGTASEE